MKVLKTETSIELQAENDFERECLQHIANKLLKAEFKDNWNRTGNLVLSFDKHPWQELAKPEIVTTRNL